LREDGFVDLIVVVGCKFQSPSIELEIVENYLSVWGINASDEAMVACPRVVGVTWKECDIVKTNLVIFQFFLCFFWMLCYNPKWFESRYLSCDFAETVNGISKYWCPIRVFVRPR
jgi:hypothetical protein